jgi:acyl carrier protein
MASIAGSEKKNVSMEDFLPQIRNAFQTALHVDPSMITMETEPSDVPAWDSMGHVTLATSLEQEFGVNFDVDDLMEMENVREICRIVQVKLARA